MRRFPQSLAAIFPVFFIYTRLQIFLASHGKLSISMDSVVYSIRDIHLTWNGYIRCNILLLGGGGVGRIYEDIKENKESSKMYFNNVIDIISRCHKLRRTSTPERKG